MPRASTRHTDGGEALTALAERRLGVRLEALRDGRDDALWRAVAGVPGGVRGFGVCRACVLMFPVAAGLPWEACLAPCPGGGMADALA